MRDTKTIAGKLALDIRGTIALALDIDPKMEDVDHGGAFVFVDEWLGQERVQHDLSDALSSEEKHLPHRVVERQFFQTVQADRHLSV